MRTAHRLAALALAVLTLCCADPSPGGFDEPPCPLPPPEPSRAERGALAAGPSQLSPIDPACARGAGREGACWKEWLKQPGRVAFTPVERGALGAGPWPTSAVVSMSSDVGLSGPITGVGVDTGQNLWAVSAGSLYVRRPGAAQFERYDRNTNGLRDYPLLSVAGGAPGVGFVGSVGVVTSSESDDPPEIARSGDLQRIELLANGIRVTTLDTHDSHTAKSGLSDHVRVINDIVIPRRGPAAGEMFVGSEHAVVRYQGNLYVDHRHTSTLVGGSERYGSARALTVTDDGILWYGSDYKIGGLAWTARRLEWYAANPWILAMSAFDSATDRDNYEGIGVDSKGAIWAAARGKGLAKIVPSPTGALPSITRYAVPSNLARDLVVDLNDTVWLSTNGGLYRFDPAAERWTRFTAAGSTSFDLFLDDTVVPRALYVGTSGGLVVYRGP